MGILTDALYPHPQQQQQLLESHYPLEEGVILPIQDHRLEELMLHHHLEAQEETLLGRQPQMGWPLVNITQQHRHQQIYRINLMWQ